MYEYTYTNGSSSRRTSLSSNGDYNDKEDGEQRLHTLISDQRNEIKALKKSVQVSQDDLQRYKVNLVEHKKLKSRRMTSSLLCVVIWRSNKKAVFSINTLWRLGSVKLGNELYFRCALLEIVIHEN